MTFLIEDCGGAYKAYFCAYSALIVFSAYKPLREIHRNALPALFLNGCLQRLSKNFRTPGSTPPPETLFA